MDSGKIVRPNAFGEISKERGGTEDFRGSHGFQRQRRMEAEDFVGVIWFLGVMKGGGGFWGIALFLGVTERGAEDFEKRNHTVFSGNEGWRRRILWESCGFQG